MIFLGKKEIFQNFFHYLFSTDEEKRNRGNHLGIFIYISLYLFALLPFNFSNHPYISLVMNFYIFFDILAILYIILFFYKERKTREFELKQLFKFPSALELFFMALFVGICYGCFKLIYIFTLPFLANIFTEDLWIEIFFLIRVVPVEEIVFRGLGLFLLIETLNITFNKERYKEVIIIKSKKTTTKFDRINKIIWYISIIIIGIVFGFYHFFRFYNEYTFPYYEIISNGELIRLHISVPIMYISILGLLLGICQMKFGLTGAMGLHFINNFFANAIIFNLIICL